MSEICFGHVHVHVIPKKNPFSKGEFENTIEYVLLEDNRPGPEQTEGTINSICLDDIEDLQLLIEKLSEIERRWHRYLSIRNMREYRRMKHEWQRNLAISRPDCLRFKSSHKAEVSS